MYRAGGLENPPKFTESPMIRLDGTSRTSLDLIMKAMKAVTMHVHTASNTCFSVCSNLLSLWALAVHPAGHDSMQCVACVAPIVR